MITPKGDLDGDSPGVAVSVPEAQRNPAGGKEGEEALVKPRVA